MDIQTVVANVQRRKREEAVNNELALHALRFKQAAFKELCTDLLTSLTGQVGHLRQQGIVLHINTEGNKTTVNRDDSAKTLTILFTPAFCRVSFAYDGGAAFKRTLTVEAKTVSGLSSREVFYYRRENDTVVQRDAIDSQVSELLDTLLA